MYLTLEVVSPQAASLGSERRRIVGPKGLTIGRVPGNDWVIPDPYISKQHARISYANGAFFVESLGRNAIAIGSASNALPGNQPQPLRNGDHLFIDQYEIIVATMQGDPPGAPGPAAASDDPFGVLPAHGAQAPFGGGPGRAPQAPLIPDVWDGGVAGGLGDTAELDPLAALGGARPAQPEALPPVNWQQASPLGDHFEPPPARAPAPAAYPPRRAPAGTPFELLEPGAAPLTGANPPPAASGIPDNWDRTNLTHIESSPASRPPARPPTPSPGARPVNREAAMPRPANADPAFSRASGRAASPAPRAAPAPRTEPPLRSAPPTQYESPLGADPVPRAEPALRSPPPSRMAADQSGGMGPAASAVGGDLADLLRGAGLSEQDLSQEMMRDLGKVLRVVVEGVMDVLRARTEIKSQFRLPLTRIQSAENNPLKHSPNVESALHTLLVQRNPGYLSTVQAFEDAFADIRNHQMAMLEGLRTAFESMLESFDPEELQKLFEGAGKSGGLFGGRGGKSRYWDLYVAHFANLGRDADDTYRRLFGDVFAEAYEKQLERLKTLGRNTGKT